MQSELKAAGEREWGTAQRLAQLEEQDSQHRSLAQQAQEDASGLRGELQSLSEVLAQRDSELQVNPCTPEYPDAVYVMHCIERKQVSVQAFESPISHRSLSCMESRCVCARWRCSLQLMSVLKS